MMAVCPIGVKRRSRTSSNFFVFERFDSRLYLQRSRFPGVCKSSLTLVPFVRNILRSRIASFAVASACAVLTVWWFSQAERENSPVILEGTPPSDEIGVLRQIEPRINEVVRDLTEGRISLPEATDMIGPLIRDSSLRHGLMFFKGKSDAESLARMLLFWAKTTNDAQGSEEAAKSAERLASEFESLFPSPLPPPALVQRDDFLQ